MVVLVSVWCSRQVGFYEPVPGRHTPMTQLLETQSTPVWQGNAHFPYCVLQWWSPQTASFWQGSANRPGVDIGAVDVGAGVGAGAGAGPGGGVYVATGAGA